MQKKFKFIDLQEADLHIDALYAGGNNKNVTDDPINKLMGCGNQGGFRFVGSAKQLKACRLIVLYTSGYDLEWPDFIDVETGSFIYFGDNKNPGHLLHDTPRKGNILLKNIFEALHTNNRTLIPPIFIFSKGFTGRDVVFRGLCVPGFHGYSQTEDLVAVWKIKDNQRFQNYKAIFSILNIAYISRQWINDIINNNKLESNFCPKEYSIWIASGKPDILSGNKTSFYRTKEEQLPIGEDLENLIFIFDFFKSDPFQFERCAAEITMLMDKNFISYDLTRPWVDGGRDATGTYKIGDENTSIKVEYALEAKCYSVKNSVGVKGSSRLISRIRHRQFGVLITTSYIHHQAYKEIVDDKHPIILISGKDIISILRKAGIKTKNEIQNWLNSIRYKS